MTGELGPVELVEALGPVGEALDYGAWRRLSDTNERLAMAVAMAVAVGIPNEHIERMMRRGTAAVETRLAAIRKRGLVPWLVRAYGLPVALRADGEMWQAGAVWADWRPLAHRFRALALAWGRLGRGERITGFERRLLAGVLGAFMRFHLPEHPLTGEMHRVGMVKTEVLGEARGLYEGWVRTPVHYI